MNEPRLLFQLLLKIDGCSSHTADWHRSIAGTVSGLMGFEVLVKVVVVEVKHVTGVYLDTDWGLKFAMEYSLGVWINKFCLSTYC